MMSLEPSSPSSRPDGILLSRDLIFTSKITGTARALGRLVLTIGSRQKASEMLTRWQPRVVFVDLAAGDLIAPDLLMTYRQISPVSLFIAFGSHVDTASLAAAEAAGCDRVMPRSRFTTELPDLIRTLFAE